MKLRFLLIASFLPFTISVELLVERGEQESYDRIIWDGDCSKINGNFLRLDEENMCVCQKRINMHGIRTEIYGTLYPNNNGFAKCSYFHRETGSNVFIHPYYNTDIFVIDDSSFEKWYGISIEINKYWPTEFELSTIISIKELLLYNFRKEEPFTRIPNSIFSMINYTSSETRKKYYLKFNTPAGIYLLKVNNRNNTTRCEICSKVNTKVTRKLRGNLMQILFERKDRQDNETHILGYTVVKFVGDRYYDLEVQQNITTQAPPTSLALEFSTEGCKYKAAAIALAVTGAVLLIVNIILMTWGCFRKRKREAQKNAKVFTLGVKGAPGKDNGKPAQQTFQEYRNLDQVEKVDYKQLRRNFTANGSSNQNIITIPEHIYESYDPVKMDNNCVGNDHIKKSNNNDNNDNNNANNDNVTANEYYNNVTANEYYNKDYCSFSVKQK